ncbi:unnamed protein product [Gordionus sp. m RMFG-2023]
MSGREGKGRKGKERKGKERKGKERKGKERKGKERKGKERKGKERKGKERKGKERKGKERKGKERKGKERKGKERKGKERKGKERKGKERKGKERKGKERKRKEERVGVLILVSLDSYSKMVNDNFLFFLIVIKFNSHKLYHVTYQGCGSNPCQIQPYRPYVYYDPHKKPSCEYESDGCGNTLLDLINKLKPKCTWSSNDCCKNAKDVCIKDQSNLSADDLKLMAQLIVALQNSPKPGENILTQILNYIPN